MLQTNNNNYKFSVDGKTFELPKVVTGIDIRKAANIQDDFLLFLKIEGRDEEVKEDENVDLARIGIEHFYTLPKNPKFKFIFNNREYIWTRFISGKELREFVRLADGDKLFLKVEGQDEELDNTSRVDLARFGLEHFYSKKVVYNATIDHKMYVFGKPLVLGREILETAGKIPIECYSLYQKLEGCDFEKISLNETVDLANKGIEQFITKPPEVFYYTVDDEPEMTDQKEMSPTQILTNAGIDPNEHYLLQVNADGTETSYKDNPDVPIQMKCPKAKFISILKGPATVS